MYLKYKYKILALKKVFSKYKYSKYFFKIKAHWKLKKNTKNCVLYNFLTLLCTVTCYIIQSKQPKEIFKILFFEQVSFFCAPQKFKRLEKYLVFFAKSCKCIEIQIQNTLAQKYWNTKYKYIFKNVFKIQIQNTFCREKKYFKYIVFEILPTLIWPRLEPRPSTEVTL